MLEGHEGVPQRHMEDTMTHLAGLLTALRWTEAAAGLKPVVKADYCGVMKGIELWTLGEGGIL